MPKYKRTLCAVCDEPSKVKMATVYWSWTWPSGDRRCYKQFFDATCFAPIFEALRDNDEMERCLYCLQPAEQFEDLDFYATYYIPGRERGDARLALHEACLAQGEERYIRNAVRMPDRSPAQAGASGAVRGNPWESWEQFGVEPT